MYDIGTEVPNSGRESRGGGFGEGREESLKSNTRLVCGLRRRRFWILVGVGVLLVLAAIGGGVGGTMARRNQEKVHSVTTTISLSIIQLQASTTSSTSSTISTASLTSTSTPALPTTTRALPAFSVQTYEFSNLTGRSVKEIR